MANSKFGLLDLADGESGEAAVSVAITKVKAAAAAARKAEAAVDAAAAGTGKEKAPNKNLYFTKLQLDNGMRNIEHELKRLRDVLIKLRGEETKLKENGEDGGRLMQLSEEQRKLRQEQRRLRVQEAKLSLLRKEFYLEHGFSIGADEEEPQVPNQAESVQVSDNAGADNVNGSCNGDGKDDERQVEEGSAYSNNGGRQGYPEVRYKRKVQKYVVKGKAKEPSSGAGTGAEEKVISDASSEAEHKTDHDEAATPANVDVATASGSEKSSAAGAAACNNGQGDPRTNMFVRKEKLNGSMKRKNKNSKNGGGIDKLKKQDLSETEEPPREQEKKTLAEYEREQKKSSEDASRTEARKVSDDEFRGLQMLKKLDDGESIMIKEEKLQQKSKKPQAEAKVPKKVVIPLKDLSFAPPRRTFFMEDGSSNGGGFQGRSRDKSIDNGRAVQNEAGNGASRGGGGGYHDQGSNGGGYYHQQQSGYERRPRGRSYSGNGRYPAPAPKPILVEEFPPLPAASAPARGAAPAAAAATAAVRAQA